MACILLVDDYLIFTSALAATLRRHGHEALTAADGAEAMAVLRFARPAVIVLDIAMPRVGGLELLQVIKMHQHWRHIPVIVLTAMTGKELEEAERLGATLVLRKAEVSLKELVGHVVAAADRPVAAA